MGSSSSKTASSASSTSSHTTVSSPTTKFASDFPSPAVQRAFSFPTPLVHHPPARKGDTHHLVSLTSTSYGSLLLIDLDGSTKSSDQQQTLPRISISGKTTSDPSSRDSFSPDSVINTWELMDGLDDEFEFEIPKPGKLDLSLNSEFCPKPVVNRNVGLTGSALKLDESYEFVRIEEDVEDWVPLSYKPKQPLWKHLSQESFISGLDPTIVSSYKKALSSKQLSNLSNNVDIRNPVKPTTSNPLIPSSEEPKSVCSTPTLTSQAKPRLPGTEDKIVLYFTSLRGIRKTYEDCCCVRAILRGLQVTVDERDISMDSKYRKELQSLIGTAEKPVSLPQVFIRGTRVGGVEEIMKLNDGGELAEMLKDFPACECLGMCRNCGDARFVPCTNCDGSTKVFEEQDERFRRCPKCNENGLVRCRECCV
uniref:Glutaredoxin domain-containing protein n=1 Tax=Noccaea caerulescens TaxID=107243 RepID=A0A1J3FIU8_NOCCA